MLKKYQRGALEQSNEQAGVTGHLLLSVSETFLLSLAHLLLVTAEIAYILEDRFHIEEVWLHNELLSFDEWFDEIQKKECDQILHLYQSD